MGRSPRKKSVRAATLADVGRLAGVSAMAASKVLNNAKTSSRISAETREKILEAAIELRYRPNAAARALAELRMHTIGVATVIDGGELNYYFLEVFNGIIGGAKRHGQNTAVFALTDWDADAEKLGEFCDGRIDGIILIAPNFNKPKYNLIPDHTPFVTINAGHMIPGKLNLDCEEEGGIYDMVKYLVSQNHRRILHMTGTQGLKATEKRLNGYRRALEEMKIPFDDSLIIETGFSNTSARYRLLDWLHARSGEFFPDAIVCANDAIAIGALETLSEYGLQVPRDISVTGFDDSVFSRTTFPQLTTVRQPLKDMGHAAVDELLKFVNQSRIQSKKETVETMKFKTEIVLRSSTGAAVVNKIKIP